MKNCKINKILKEFYLVRPDLKPKGVTESGNRGFAVALVDGRHLKITSDKTEIEVCQTLVGLKNEFLCDVYETGRFYSSSNDCHYGWIVEEHLYKDKDQEWLNEAFNDFRHAWFSLYPELLQRFTWSDLWLIYKGNQTEKISKTKGLLEEYIRHINENGESRRLLTEDEITIRLKRGIDFFEFISNAYDELFSHCPNGRIDLNEGNFMFTADGRIKTLDMQTESF